MPSRIETIPLTPGSQKRLKQAAATVEQVMANYQGLVTTILEAMGCEGRLIEAHVEEGYVVMEVPGLTVAEPDPTDVGPDSEGPEPSYGPDFEPVL